MQFAKEDLEIKQNELKAMMEHLEESKHLELEEKQKLENAIQRKQEEVMMMKEEVQMKGRRSLNEIRITESNRRIRTNSNSSFR